MLRSLPDPALGPTSLRVRERLRALGVPFAANDSIAEHLEPGEAEALEAEVMVKVDELLDALVIDRDHNTAETPRRVAKMFVRELFRGRYEAMPRVTDFPNARQLDELYAVGPITVRSVCSHHLVPIVGDVWIGVLAKERVIGLSKFARLTAWVMARPQIQEEATVQLADLVERLIVPQGLAVVVKAVHMCMTCRGVQEHDTAMVTSVMRGSFRSRPEARAEFLALVKA